MDMYHVDEKLDCMLKSLKSTPISDIGSDLLADLIAITLIINQYLLNKEHQLFNNFVTQNTYQVDTNIVEKLKKWIKKIKEILQLLCQSTKGLSYSISVGMGLSVSITWELGKQNNS